MDKKTAKDLIFVAKVRCVEYALGAIVTAVFLIGGPLLFLYAAITY